MIKNIVLDMGNVLLDYNPDISLDKFCPNGEAKEIIRRELFEGPEWAMGDRGEIADRDRYERVMPRVPEKYREALKNCALYWDICMTPIEGARAFCEYVKARGLGIYVLSNASDKFYEYFPNFAPFEYFDGIVVSADEGVTKPNIRIYEIFLERFGLKPDECLFIDDREDNARGARAAGMRAFVFGNDFGAVKAVLD
ncbi:MAG: HAD family phosphatase [Butyrivibrio sp.]|nr:HAD family phosphatase [Butyrivibrio sp.]